MKAAISVHGGSAMGPSPQPATAFSEADTAMMRDAYLLASNALAATHCLDNGSKYRLASIILHIFACERQSRDLGDIDRASVAEEAIEILLETPRPRTGIGTLP